MRWKRCSSVTNMGMCSNYSLLCTTFLFFLLFSWSSSIFFFCLFFYYSIRNNRMHKATRCVESIIDEREYTLLTGMIRERKKSTGDICRSWYWKIEPKSQTNRHVFSPFLFFSELFSPVIPRHSELSVFRKYFERHSVMVLSTIDFHSNPKSCKMWWLDLKIRFSKLSST